MTNLSSLALRAGLAVLLGLSVAVAADAQPARQAPALDARLDQLASTLDLDAQQQARLDAVAARYADADPADLWAASAEVADVLTDEQTARLSAFAQGHRAGARTAGRGPRGGRARGTRGDRGQADGARRSRGGQGRAERTPLTDAQREALRAIRTDTRARTEALADRFRAGAIDADALAAGVRQLRADAVSRSAAALPAEASARLTERHAQRAAAAAARDAALGLTAAQRTALATRRLSHERPDLRPYLDDQGRLDREALRQAQRAQRAERGPRADVLTDDQRAVVAVHAAIAGRGGRGGRHDGRRR